MFTTALGAILLKLIGTYLLCHKPLTQDHGASFHSAYHPHGFNTPPRMHNNVRNRTESDEVSAKDALFCLCEALIPHIHH